MGTKIDKRKSINKAIPARKKRRMVTKSENKLEKLTLTEQNKAFCREYIFDWNATRSYKVAYGINDDNVAAAASSRLLRVVKIQAFIKAIQTDIEKVAGISRLKVLQEQMKIAYGTMAHLHLTWITRKEFETLTDDQKSCIAEIDTKTRTEYAYDPDDPKEKKPISVEYVRIKLYDKQKALDAISKMMGYDAPQKIDLTNAGDKFEAIDYSKLDDAVLRAIIAATKSD